MNLFKVNIGLSSNLVNMPLTSGYAYFCPDNATFFMDYLDSDGTVKRKQINEALFTAITEHESAINTLKTKKIYEHNIRLWYRHTAQTLTDAGPGEGMFEATFTLRNDDYKSYSFSHNISYSEATMPADTAWNLYRLFGAIALSREKDTDLARPTSGASICVLEDGAETRCVNSMIRVGYSDELDRDWVRQIIVTSSRIDTGSLGGISLKIDCGHPVFDSTTGAETSLWLTQDEFVANEYNLTDSFNTSYSTYFCRHQVRCTDTVRTIYTGE